MELIKVPNPKAGSPEATGYKQNIDVFQAEFERRCQERAQELLRIGYPPSEAASMVGAEFAIWHAEIIRMRTAWNELYGPTTAALMSKEEAAASGRTTQEPTSDG